MQDPLEPNPSDSPDTVMAKREAQYELSGWLHSFEEIGFTYTKHARVIRLTCRHGAYTYQMDRTVYGRRTWPDDFRKARAEHREHCGEE